MRIISEAIRSCSNNSTWAISSHSLWCMAIHRTMGNNFSSLTSSLDIYHRKAPKLSLQISSQKVFIMARPVSFLNNSNSNLLTPITSSTLVAKSIINRTISSSSSWFNKIRCMQLSRCRMGISRWHRWAHRTSQVLRPFRNLRTTLLNCKSFRKSPQPLRWNSRYSNLLINWS